MILWRKTGRDMLSNAGSYLACLTLVVIGMLAFLAFAIARDNLVSAQEKLYREQNFADGFIELVAMPEHRLATLSRLEGIDEITGRLVRDVRVHKPGEDRRTETYLRLVSLDLREESRLNDVRLDHGRPLRRGLLEAWLDSQFFEANSLEISDSLQVIAGGRAWEFNIAGAGISPEFVYPLRTQHEIYNDPELFGIAFVSQEIIWQLFPDQDNSVNSIVFTLSPGSDFDGVKERLESRLEQYGVLEIYPRADQRSHFILQEEIEIINNFATFFPVLILLVAAFIIYIVLKRLVEQQRGQIGILKAFGYRRREILFHYFSYPLILAVAGGVIGSLCGMWLANPLTELLYQFFYLPEVYLGFSWHYLVSSLLICVSVLGFAGYQGCKTVLRLSPAEAMQPAAPVKVRRNLLESFRLFTAMLTVQGKMAVRNLNRSRSRTAFVFFSLTVSCAIVAFTWGLWSETMPDFMFYQYENLRTYDARVNLETPLPRKSVMREAERLAEVVRSEPLAEVPATLSHKYHREDVGIMGVAKDARLYNILDQNGARISPSPAGLILSRRLADNLGASVGSTLELESVYLRDKDASVSVPVTAIIPQYIGMNAYMTIEGLEKLLDQGNFVTSVLLEFNQEEANLQDRINRLRDDYGESDYITGIDSRQELIKTMMEYWEMAGWMVFLYVMIGVAFSFSIIYISSLVILSERQRELASMRVLGMSRNEVFSVISFEQWFIAFFAILTGLPLGRAIMAGFAREWSTDMYTMPAEISASSLAAGAIITVISIWAAQRFSIRKIKKLDLVEALKTRE